jgi:ABC-type transport system, involved in lipoprotein release, permease component
MYDYDANFVYAPMADAQRLLNLGNKVSTIEVFLKEGTPLAEARRLVTQVVGLQGWVFDWYQTNFGFFAAIQGQTNVMFVVLTMIVLVAAFNIVSSLVMLVRTKTADIAILRTMGATRGAILRLFLLDGWRSAASAWWSAPRWGSPSPPISRRSASGCSTHSASCCSTRRFTSWPRCPRTSNGRRWWGSA